MEPAHLEPTETTGIVTNEEAWRIFEEQCQELLGMSAGEFIGKYDSGHWPDPDANGDVMYVQSVRQFAE